MPAVVAALPPGYFALVMGTGIISTGLHGVGWEGLSLVLMWIAIVAYPVLCALYLWRAFAFRRELVADLRDPKKAFGFFTIIASTDVLAVRLHIAGFTEIASCCGSSSGMCCPGRCCSPVTVS